MGCLLYSFCKRYIFEKSFLKKGILKLFQFNHQVCYLGLLEEMACVSQKVSVEGTCHSLDTKTEGFDFVLWEVADTGGLPLPGAVGQCLHTQRGGCREADSLQEGPKGPLLGRLGWRVLAWAERPGAREAKLAAAERRSPPP